MFYCCGISCFLQTCPTRRYSDLNRHYLLSQVCKLDLNLGRRIEPKPCCPLLKCHETSLEAFVIFLEMVAMGWIDSCGTFGGCGIVWFGGRCRSGSKFPFNRHYLL